ncbi:uncharacterized protein LOC126851920 [Cataglyphis hispanica]|uniref:uncharacterized protein LOC126851920 n=1 Tax=Cataglyphis hispanica TaxID=1086592 RepID=UPI00217FE639|nr:uncharacterized protein LOC126851920 [Cataglyphis hispanica]
MATETNEDKAAGIQDSKIRSQKGFRNVNGTIIVSKEEVHARWKEYFQQLLNGGTCLDNDAHTSDPRLYNNNPHSEDVPPSFREVESTMGKLKNRKAPGKNNIPAELVKWWWHKIIKQIWTKEILPEDWKKGVICPIFKKGDKFECTNYRDITLLSAAYKICPQSSRTRWNHIQNKSCENTKQGLQIIYVELDKAAERIGLQINEDKNKVLVTTRKT